MLGERKRVDEFNRFYLGRKIETCFAIPKRIDNRDSEWMGRLFDVLRRHGYQFISNMSKKCPNCESGRLYMAGNLWSCHRCTYQEE